MAYGFVKRDKWKDREEVNHIWRIECLIKGAKTKISAELIWKEV